MGEIILGVVVVGAVLAAFLLYQRSQHGAPVAYKVAANDPDLVAAREKAQATLAEFRKLHAAHPNDSMVKVLVTSSTGMLERMFGGLVRTPAGKYRGGFTQRVHFERMRAAGTLVGAAAEEAAKYE